MNRPDVTVTASANIVFICSTSLIPRKSTKGIVGEPAPRVPSPHWGRGWRAHASRVRGLLLFERVVTPSPQPSPSMGRGSPLPFWRSRGYDAQIWTRLTTCSKSTPSICTTAPPRRCARCRSRPSQIAADTIPNRPNASYDVRVIIDDIVDAESRLELRAGMGAQDVDAMGQHRTLRPAGAARRECVA